MTAGRVARRMRAARRPLRRKPRIGSLFSGYGGLDMGVQAVLGGSVAWHVEFDAAPSKILEHRFPGVPNYGDVTAVDWSTAEPVDVLIGGFPCQDVSLAGMRRGLQEGTRSGLWSEFARAIDALRPQLVVIENVRGLLSAKADRNMEPDPGDLGDGERRPVLRALGAVLGDLAELGYDTRWGGFRASDAGAPHQRFRVFIVAYPYGSRLGQLRRLVTAERDAHRRDRTYPDGYGAAPAAPAEDPHIAAGSERRLAAPGQAEAGRARSDAGRRGRASASDAAGRRRDRRAQAPIRSSLERTPAARRGRAVVAHADTERVERRWERDEQPGRTAAPRSSAVAAAAANSGRVSAAERRRGPRGLAGAARLPRQQAGGRDVRRYAAVDRREAAQQWGPYTPAVERWEGRIGRNAPAPTELSESYVKMLRRRLERRDARPVGMRGSLAPRHNLSPAFVEWMMGLPAGWLTDPAVGLSRAEQLKALGNGVVPQQAALAVATLLAAEIGEP